MDFTQLWNTLSANPLAVAIISVIATALVINFAPWLSRQLVRLGGALVAFAGGRGQDFQFERKYLNWLIDRHAYLGLVAPNVAVQMRGHKQTTDLEQVFVDLQLTSSGGGETETRAIQDVERYLPGRRRTEGIWRYVPERFRPEERRVISQLGSVVEQHKRLVIRGDPGSGKTTLMKYLAVTCARSRRNHPRQGDSSTVTRERLGWDMRPFPVFVSLGKQGAVVTWAKNQTLLDTFADEFASELSGCPDGFFERRLKRGNCLVLLDAFDEIGSRDGRAAMARHVAGLLNNTWHPTNRLVVTTRIVGYEEQLDPHGFTVQTVQPLTREQMRELVDLRYRALAVNESLNQTPDRRALVNQDFVRRAQRLNAELSKNPRLRELGANPLLLSLIVLVDSFKARLPEERHILYRDCVEILTENWQAYKKEMMGVLRTDRKDDLNLEQKIELLKGLAVTMQEQRTDVQEGQVPLLRRRAQDLIAVELPRYLAAQLPADPDARTALVRQKADEWLEGIKLESGILEEFGFDRTTGEPLVRFSHLTFQEYLAAAAYKDIPGVPTVLEHNLLHSVWEEVVLLYMALSPAGRANEFAERLLERSTSQDARGLWIAARAVTDKIALEESTRLRIMNGLHDALTSPDAKSRERACELLEQLGTRDSALHLVKVLETDTEWSVRYAAGRALGRLGDPRFDKLESETVSVPAGEFLMGKGDEQHTVPLSAYRIGKYPVTNAEYKRFVDETDHPVPNADWGGSYNWDSVTRMYPEGRANHPVVLVSWHDARAYCEWLSHKTGKLYHLPTEAEWEKAASWDNAQNTKRVYSWGDEFDKDKCNTFQGCCKVVIAVEKRELCSRQDLPHSDDAHPGSWTTRPAVISPAPNCSRPPSSVPHARCVACTDLRARCHPDDSATHFQSANARAPTPASAAALLPLPSDW